MNNICKTIEMGGSFIQALNLEKNPNYLQKKLNVLKNFWDKIKRNTECKALSDTEMYSKDSDVNWMLGKRPHQEVQSEQSGVSEAEEACGRTTLGNAAEESVPWSYWLCSSLSLTKNLEAINWDIQSASGSLRAEIARFWAMENEVAPPSAR